MQKSGIPSLRHFGVMMHNDMMEKVLSLNPDNRPTMEELHCDVLDTIMEDESQFGIHPKIDFHKISNDPSGEYAMEW